MKNLKVWHIAILVFFVVGLVKVAQYVYEAFEEPATSAQILDASKQCKGVTATIQKALEPFSLGAYTSKPKPLTKSDLDQIVSKCKVDSMNAATDADAQHVVEQQKKAADAVAAKKPN